MNSGKSSLIRLYDYTAWFPTRKINTTGITEMAETIIDKPCTWKLIQQNIF